ncbi:MULTISPECIES: glutathione peroxidase [Gammaproteobacteria]|uniref:glutathione peroxidase n=1 Tax=Gammaproteobacteria TaxID=1236 RepID=UPI000DD04828|nr:MULTISPECIES: redoxin domain-containing protein [Gammaproteobacteria]RTE87079.1 redoxin domain-containing protein [Aliidiomarina sp. B3213]TCZ93443.1 redoxin domain-containing protein [Lysobacter sp. N42]
MSDIYSIPVTTIDGNETTLADYKGKAMLIVNVASKCGLTPQYEQLEALYEDKKDDGLVVLGFPCNQFAGQEPGSESEIKDFCRSTFGVKFPMFSKLDVNGSSRHPLYKHLIEKQPVAIQTEHGKLESLLTEKGLIEEPGTDVMWNFEKFLVDKEGEVVARFRPDITTESPELVSALSHTV